MTYTAQALSPVSRLSAYAVLYGYNEHPSHTKIQVMGGYFLLAAVGKVCNITIGKKTVKMFLSCRVHVM